MRPDCDAITANPLDVTNEEMPGNVRIPRLPGRGIDKPRIGHPLTTLRGSEGSRMAAEEPIATTSVFG